VPDVPFGRVAPGRTALFVPWGSGPGRAGLALGLETATLGPASFDVGSGGRITVLDGLHQRLLTGGGSGRLTSFPVGRSSPDSDIVLAPDGGAYVLSSAGGRGDRPVTVRWVSLGDVPNSAADDRRAPVMVGRGLPVRLALAGAAPYVHLLPTDEWSEAEYPNGPLTPGRPLAGGGQLLSVVREGAVRLAVARGRRVLAPVELRFAASVADLQLAALDGDGGYIVVVHLWRDEPAADQYQVVHVAAGRVVQTFAVARKDFARTAALSAFRLGHDGSLFQLTSSPDGVRVLRYEIGGAA
jgi:hypothetical protein